MKKNKLLQMVGLLVVMGLGTVGCIHVPVNHKKITSYYDLEYWSIHKETHSEDISRGDAISDQLYISGVYLYYGVAYPGKLTR